MGSTQGQGPKVTGKESAEGAGEAEQETEGAGVTVHAEEERGGGGGGGKVGMPREEFAPGDIKWMASLMKTLSQSFRMDAALVE